MVSNSVPSLVTETHVQILLLTLFHNKFNMPNKPCVSLSANLKPLEGLYISCLAAGPKICMVSGYLPVSIPEFGT